VRGVSQHSKMIPLAAENSAIPLHYNWLTGGRTYLILKRSDIER
jgi:hypothetical protein